jgi:electron transport complex protein RnfC
MRLAPARLAQLSEKNEAVEAEAWSIRECIECGCCSYVCPSGISLVHQIQYGKQKTDTIVQSKATA